MNTSVDQYFVDGCGRCPLGGTADCKVHTWQSAMRRLRTIVRDCGLTEVCKWGVPCYTFEGKNVIMISAFKEYCCISFFKGALLSDKKNLLTKPGPNSHAARLFKFTNEEEIGLIEDDIKAYILEAVDIEKRGVAVPVQKKPESLPEELESRFAEDPGFKAAFEALTPGRQRGYILHFTQAKQSKTRIARIDKCMPMILSGIGLHDKYKSMKKK